MIGSGRDSRATFDTSITDQVGERETRGGYSGERNLTSRDLSRFMPTTRLCRDDWRTRVQAIDARDSEDFLPSIS